MNQTIKNSPLEFSTNSDKTTIFLQGSWDYRLSKKFMNKFLNLVKNSADIELDFKNLENLDYFTALFLRQNLKDKNYKIINSNSKIDSIFAMMSDEKIDLDYLPKKRNSGFFESVGRASVEVINNLINLATFLGEFFVKSIFLFIKPKRLRVKEIFNYAKDSGIDSLFIVGLTAFLIGIVLAYIGSDMLSRFGATIYIIDIMGMLTLREIAPLIAAIVIAGRSASSFTAQIGVMKITEEIDAMRTMGFDPFYFLAMPRILAMIIITPFVIFIADLISIVAQMIVCEAYLDISVQDYLDRFKSNVHFRHFLVGMIKAPFFGAIIAIIGCMRGFEVKGNTQSIGEFTTLSVVNAIFWVIALDAIFAVVFSELKI